MKDPTQSARLNDFLVRELESIEKGKSLEAGLLSFQYWIGGFLALIDEQGERESFVLRISSELDNEDFTDPYHRRYDTARTPAFQCHLYIQCLRDYMRTKYGRSVA
jgi:hypothetical protein